MGDTGSAARQASVGKGGAGGWVDAADAASSTGPAVVVVGDGLAVAVVDVSGIAMNVLVVGPDEWSVRDMLASGGVDDQKKEEDGLGKRGQFKPLLSMLGKMFFNSGDLLKII